MKEIAFCDLKEKETYIVESKKPIGRDSKVSIRASSEFEEMLDFDNHKIMTIIKIELPYFVIKGRHGREMVKLTDEYTYLQPSEDFIKMLNYNCNCEY